MCGRITQQLSPNQMGNLYGARATPLPPDRPPRYNGAPIETFTIITTAASPGLEDIHHRQPAIIAPRWFTDWLDPRTPLPALLELAQEPHDGPFERRAVSSRVNSVRNNDPDVLLPVSGNGMF